MFDFGENFGGVAGAGWLSPDGISSSRGTGLTWTAGVIRIGVVVAVVASAAGCSRVGFGATDELCRDVDCDGHGRCTTGDDGEASCVCDDGYGNAGPTHCTSGGQTCSSADQCDDDNPCTDDDCEAGKCVAAPNQLGCDDGDPCSTLDRCEGGQCVAGPTNKDSDGDNFFDATCSGGTDCDDNQSVCGAGCFPGNPASDICDGRDQDCDGETDEDGTSPYYHDADGDGFTADGDIVRACSDPDGAASAWVASPSPVADCRDDEPEASPAKPEGPPLDASCADMLDNDCDGLTDTDDADCDASKMTRIFRSVGPDASAALAVGTGNALTIAGTLATFERAPPANVGVGDAIQADTTGDGRADTLAFIHARKSATSYEVRATTGKAPASISNVTRWHIFRAYTTLTDAERGSENPGIAVEVRDFDPWLAGKDITASTGTNEQWNIACYADRPDRGPVVIEGWKTSPTNYVRIYAPQHSGEVGASQRHAGSLGTGYHLKTAEPNVVVVQQNYTVVEGLQLTHEGASGLLGGIRVLPDIVGVTLSHNIVRFLNAGADARAFYDDGTGSRVFDNVAYDVRGSNLASCFYHNLGASSFFYHNTAVNCETGYLVFGGSMTVKNNIVQDSAVGFSERTRGAFSIRSDFNVSDLEQRPPGANSRSLVQVTFVDSGAADYHLAAGDTGARNEGINLSQDVDAPVLDDIDGELRSAEAARWDVGADQTN